LSSSSLPGSSAIGGGQGLIHSAGTNYTHSNNPHIIGSVNSNNKLGKALLLCPSDWKIAEHSIGLTVQDCGPPCNLFSSSQKKGAAIVVGIVATSTLISSLFTIITAVLDSNRFHYPERAIVHLAVCYAGLAVCYIIGVRKKVEKWLGGDCF
jgi:hypothetical protein